MIDSALGLVGRRQETVRPCEGGRDSEDLTQFGYGKLPVANSQKAYFQPWVLSTGVTYRF